MLNSDAAARPIPMNPSGDGTRAGRPSDEDVFLAVYPALRRLAAVVAPPEIDPDDLVQEATARVLRRGPLAELDSPSAYLRRAVVNLAANERRSLGRRRRALARFDVTIVSRAEYPSDVAELLRLSPADRAVIWLTDVEGLPSDQVAALVGGTPESVRTRASRARRSLRRLLEEEL